MWFSGVGVGNRGFVAVAWTAAACAASPDVVDAVPPGETDVSWGIDSDGPLEWPEGLDTGVTVPAVPCEAYPRPRAGGTHLTESPFRVEELSGLTDTSRCLAVGDVDGDGHVDVVTGGVDGAHQLGVSLHFGDGTGAFEERFVPLPAGMSVCLLWDVDHDGSVELLVGGGHHIDKLEIASDRTAATSRFWTGADDDPETEQDVFSMAVVDLDGVGGDDLIVNLAGRSDICVVPEVDGDDTGDIVLPVVDRRPGEVWCLVSDGFGRWLRTEDDRCPAALAQQDSPFPFVTSLQDLNDDRRPEILVAADFDTNTFLVSSSTGWADRSGPSGLGEYNHAMGAAWADFDGDGLRDLFIPDYGPSQMQRNVDCTSFYDDAWATNVGMHTRYSVGWSVVASDFDGDGDEDVFYTQSFEAATSDAFLDSVCEVGLDELPLPPFVLLLNDGTGNFTRLDLESPSDRPTLENFPVVSTAGDLDEDGDLDLITAHRSQGVWVWWNEAPRAPDHHQLVVHPLDDVGAPAHGVRVIVRHAGGRARVAEQWLASSVQGQQASGLRFGLGTYDDTVTVDVRWRDGSTRTLTDVPVDRTIVVSPDPQFIPIISTLGP